MRSLLAWPGILPLALAVAFATVEARAAKGDAQKEKYLQRVQTELIEWDRRIKELSRREGAVAAGAVESIEAEAASVRRAAERLRDSAIEDWSELKRRIDQSLEKMRLAYQAARQSRGP